MSEARNMAWAFAAPPPSVSDIPDAELLRRAVNSLRYPPASKYGRRRPLWEAVMQSFALGSTYSAQLCTRVGYDPDEMVRP